MTDVVEQGPWPESTTEPQQPPLVSYEAEQALLSAILENNRAYDQVEDFLTADHFADGAHGRIYAACGKLIDQGSEANAVALRHVFDRDEALEEVGGGDYLAELQAAMVSTMNARHYGQTIYDLYLRRELVASGHAAVESAHDLDLEKPAQQLIEDFEGQLAQLTAEGSSDRLSTVGDAIESWLQQVDEAQRSGGGLVGTTTGLADLDDALGGSVPGWMVVVGGRPGMGKSVLAMQLAWSTARRYVESHGTEGGAAVVFSLEMSREQLVARMIAGRTGIPTDRQHEGPLSDQDWQALTEARQELSELPLLIDDTPAITVQQIRSRLRRIKRKYKISTVVIDYMQLMQASAQARRKDSNVAEVTELSRDLKAVASEFRVTVYPVSQLSRKVEQREDKRPQLADLRESGQIEQDADAVLFAYREAYYVERAEPVQKQDEDEETFSKRHNKWLDKLTRVQNQAELLLAKHRHRKFPRTVRVYFDQKRQLFGDLDTRHDDTEEALS
jgi:replicative DNA helicase